MYFKKRLKFDKNVALKFSEKNKKWNIILVRRILCITFLSVVPEKLQRVDNCRRVRADKGEPFICFEGTLLVFVLEHLNLRPSYWPG